MTTTLYATFDGEVLRPDHPVALPPNTRVRITVETEQDDDPRAGNVHPRNQALVAQLIAPAPDDVDRHLPLQDTGHLYPMLQVYLHGACVLVKKFWSRHL